MSCSRPDGPSQTVLSSKDVEKQIVGVYSGRYDGGLERITFDQSGTFSQTFLRNGITNYISTGKWKCRPDGDHYNIFLEPFRIHLGIFTGSTSSNKYITEMKVNYYSGDRQIEFAPKMGYYVTKEYP